MSEKFVLKVIGHFLQDCLAKEVIPKGFNLKWTLSLGSNGGGDNNIKNILNDTSEKLLNETLKVCELQMLSTQENIRKQREILAHRYNHEQLQTQENAWKNEMKSLQEKYTYIAFFVAFQTVYITQKYTMTTSDMKSQIHYLRIRNITLN